MQTNHSLISPSNFERRMLCPGSLNAEKDLPDITSKYAEKGILLHAAVNKLIHLDNWRENLTESQQIAVANAAEYFDGLKLDKQVIKEIHEQTFDLSFIYPDMKGTADSILLTQDEVGNVDLHIIDYKFGKGIAVNAYENYQLLLYLIGFLKFYNEKNRELFTAVKSLKIHLHIVQPFLSNSVWTLDEIDEAIFGDLIFYQDIAKKCYAPNALRIPNKKACQFCKAKLTCREKLEFDNLITKEESEVEYEKVKMTSELSKIIDTFNDD